MNEYPTLEELRREFGINKEIPLQYEKTVLMALSHYPELKSARIRFVPVSAQNLAYRTIPRALDLFRPRAKRIYSILILEKADPPMEKALLKNCPAIAQVGIIGHELGHVAQFHERNCRKLAGFFLLYLMKSGRRRIERGADKTAIVHGLGRELYMHAIYIRSIPGYIEQNPSLDDDYLKPEEILAYMEESSSD